MRGIAGWIDIDNKFNEPSIFKMADSFFFNSGKFKSESGIYRSTNARLLNRSIANSLGYEYLHPLCVDVPNRGKYVILYSGNLYNAQDVRNKLSDQGVLVNSKNESELLIKAFLKWDRDCLNKFNGIFSLAIWSDEKKELFLARDRIGVKSLFFYKYGNGIIFSSYINVLLSNPLVKPVINEEGLKEIFFIGPGRTPGFGVLKGIYEILPGEYAVFSCKDRTLKRKRYWRLKAKEFTDSLSVTIEKTRFLVEDSIKKQFPNNQAFCCLLSGGLDSSIVSKVAADYYKNHKKEQLTTYSVDYFNNDKYFQKSFYQPNLDKSFINTMVDYIKSKHKMVTIANGNLANSLYDATLARSLPGMADIDSSLLLFCKEIKKEYDIAFSGECADELFGGYPWYHDKNVLVKESFPWAGSLELRKSILREGVLKGADEYVYQRYKNAIKDVEKLPKESKLSSRMREVFTLNLNWFMQTLLDRGERMSSYSDLDLRVPFCDYRIVEYTYNMPWEIKALNGREKGILREAMKGILPDKVVLRKKSPYPKTHNPVFMQAVCAKVKEILKEKTSVLSTILDYENITSLMQKSESSISEPWYGQLMKIPQIMAYIIQIDCWFKKFRVKII